MSQHDDLKGAYFHETTGLFEAFSFSCPDGSSLRLRQQCLGLRAGQPCRLCPPGSIQQRSTQHSRTSRERADEALQDVPLVTTTVDGWDTYDTVFVGYPIWWGDAGWPVNGFVTGNDFTGKRVIPFCTSASSGLGQSGARLAELAGTGDWEEGRRFSSSASKTEITQWLAELGLA